MIIFLAILIIVNLIFWGRTLTIGWGTIVLFSLIGLVSNYLGVRGFIHMSMRQVTRLQQLIQKQNAGISKDQTKD
ncbi:MAG: hypothetical protein M1383_06140 [Patescibacteria group bacterium]|nr:hypothetical protein [Patescibacteria group bacterium]